jgi:hypothetical protein
MRSASLRASSVAIREAPACSRCGPAMVWYRANLRSTEPRVLTHFYACPICQHIAVVDQQDGGPATQPKLFDDGNITGGLWLVGKTAAE